jgi:hypothetical protein
MSEFLLYDYKGRPLKTVTSRTIAYYKPNEHTHIIRVPSVFDHVDNIRKFLTICLETKLGLHGPSEQQPEMSDAEIADYIQTLWKVGRQNTKRVIDMLYQRAKELYEQGSIRTLIYQELYDKFNKLKVPLFTRVQVAVIPNITTPILDEIEQVLTRDE